jgi:hypothetical protein
MRIGRVCIIKAYIYHYYSFHLACTMFTVIEKILISEIVVINLIRKNKAVIAYKSASFYERRGRRHNRVCISINLPIRIN